MKRIFILTLFICMVAAAIGYILYRYNRMRMESGEFVPPSYVGDISIIDVNDLEARAKEVIPHGGFDYIAGKIQEKIKEFDTIVIARHIGADPDALGSQFALRELILNKFPKKEVYAVGAPASNFRYLGYLDKFDDSMYENALMIVLDNPDIKITHTRCHLCENHCLLTINKFNNFFYQIQLRRLIHSFKIQFLNFEIKKKLKIF